MARELPRVKIGNKEYYMDSRTREFRSYTQQGPIKFLGFKKIMESDQTVSIIQPSREIIHDKENIIISCLTEREMDDLGEMVTEQRDREILPKIPYYRE